MWWENLFLNLDEETIKLTLEKYNIEIPDNFIFLISILSLERMDLEKQGFCVRFENYMLGIIQKIFSTVISPLYRIVKF